MRARCGPFPRTAGPELEAILAEHPRVEPEPGAVRRAEPEPLDGLVPEAAPRASASAAAAV